MHWIVSLGAAGSAAQTPLQGRAVLPFAQFTLFKCLPLERSLREGKRCQRKTMVPAGKPQRQRGVSLPAEAAPLDEALGARTRTRWAPVPAAPPRPAHQALPALSIQARYPFSSRSICCWRRSFMKALRFSTRSLSLANSLWTGRRRGTRFRQRHDEEKGGAGPPGVSVRAPHPLAPSRSPRRHLCSLKCCTGTRSTRPPAGSLPRSVSLPWALTPSACSLLKGTFLVATECATTWVSKCYV